MATTLEETKEQLVAEVVAESEKRTEANVAESTAGLGAELAKLRTDVHRLDDRTVVAAGHGRSGFLLAPWTAEEVVTQLLPIGAR